MPFIHPIFGLKTPSPATPLNELGTDMKALGTSLETILNSFDYNGADPNLVLSRVAALEAEKRTLQQGVVTFTVIAANGVQTQNVTFPQPFDELPFMGSPSFVADTGPSYSIFYLNVTLTGMSMRIRNLASGTQTPGQVRWTALGRLA